MLRHSPFACLAECLTSPTHRLPSCHRNVSHSWLLNGPGAQNPDRVRASGMAFISSGNSAIRRALGQARSAAGRLGGYGVFWLKALRQPTIDLTIRTHAGLITRIVETPGLSLSEAELGRSEEHTSELQSRGHLV